MRSIWVLSIAVLALVGCDRDLSEAVGGDTKAVLTVNWQRMVTGDGQTCDRCGGTEDELRKAIGTLQQSLRPLGIEVAFVEGALTIDECAADIIQSNRIVVGDRSLEEWLGGEVGQSSCGSCCSAIGEEVECRTLRVDGSTYEVIPADLIVRAGLLAASGMIGAPPATPCCPGETTPCDTDAPCCPGHDKEDGAAT